LRALKAMGASDAGYLVPNRFEYGYGLTEKIVAVAAERSPALILTVDNGVSSIEGVAAARSRGIKVLVTDHHLPGEALPAADAIVNPNLPGDAFPSKNLAGVGVVFYIMAALRRSLRQAGWFAQRGIPEPKLAEHLDLVALGTVADVVPLDANNRIMVEQGVRRIRAGQAKAGIHALLKIGGRDHRRVVSADLGFAVAPRLNAAGRLSDMSLGIECLLTDEDERALTMAQELDALNRERREIERQMKDEALTILAEFEQGENGMSLPCGICVYERQWHQGVIGILAARLKDRYQRPVIAFADGSNDGELRGSARSIAGVHVRDVLDRVATAHPGLISKFGGHAGAAGLSLPHDHLETFRHAFDAAVREVVTAEQLDGKLISDGELKDEHICIEVAELLRAAAPWGQGFPEPVFDGVFEIVGQRVIGEVHRKLVVKREGQRGTVEALMFNADSFGWRESDKHVRIAFRLDVNDYQGYRTPQLVVVHIEPA
ncbi:MAG: single-stranded-DNA-specific exonuclease RecJ, partial [Gammaproteobacteria bacterium]